MTTPIRCCLLGLLLGVTQAGGAVEGDYTVIPGQGLKAVYIGQDAKSAAQRLGPPRESLYGFIYLYELPDGTKLSYRLADKRVGSVNFVGGSTSRYQAAGGGKFGMTRSQIETLYGKPDAEAVNKIFYNRLGVGFFFKGDSVSEFWVFAPR